MRVIDADRLKRLCIISLEKYGSQYSQDMINMFGLFQQMIDEAPTLTNKDIEESFDCYCRGIIKADHKKMKKFKEEFLKLSENDRQTALLWVLSDVDELKIKNIDDDKDDSGLLTED